MTTKYRVILAFEIEGGASYGYGQIAELDAETATQYSHALIACEEEDANGGDK